MNHISIIGRLCKDVDLSYSAQNQTAIARYTLAVDRIKEGTDFINCVAFTKSAEFAEKYFKKGMKVAVEGRLQTGSYKNKDGQTVYTADVIVSNQEFCESKKDNTQEAPSFDASAGFANIPEGLDEDLPFAAPTR